MHLEDKNDFQHGNKDKVIPKSKNSQISYSSKTFMYWHKTEHRPYQVQGIHKPQQENTDPNE